MRSSECPSSVLQYVPKIFETPHPNENNRSPPHIHSSLCARNHLRQCRSEVSRPTGPVLAATVQTHILPRCRLCVSAAESEPVLTGPSPVSVTDLQTLAPRSPGSASSLPQALSLSLCSHTARLDICGPQIEMQVVIVIRMIDAFLLVSHELEGKKNTNCRVHMQNIYARKHTHTHTHTLTMTKRGVCAAECILSVRACREKKG